MEENNLDNSRIIDINKENPTKNEKKEEVIKDYIEGRTDKIKDFFMKRGMWIYFFILGIIIWLGTFIRTRNLPILKDITTGTWTLGPDLDPFLFLRWAKHIVENGSLMTIDTMRYVPLGYNTSGEMALLSYLMAWFHNLLNFFGLSGDITYSAVLFPVFMFILTPIAFFLLVRKIFHDKFENKRIPNIIALIASAFLVVLPSLLPRTIAGIPEKESTAFFFLFLGLYLFLEAWTSKKLKKRAILSMFAGLTAGLLALIWGGFMFLTLTIGLTIFISLILKKVENSRIIDLGIWILFFMGITMLSSERYTLRELLTATSMILIYVSFFIMIIHILIFKFFKEVGERIKKKIRLPSNIISIVLGIMISLIAVILFLGPEFIIYKIQHTQLISPLGISRFLLTVAENKQPFFVEWSNSFGPVFQGIPLFFWLFFIGSIYLVYETLKKISVKERMIITFSYIIFLFCLIFSRYSAESTFNGVNGISKFVFFGGILLLIGSCIYVYYKYLKEDKLYLFKRIDIASLLILSLFFLSVLAARSAVRLIMVLGVVATIIVAYFVVAFFLRTLKKKDELGKALSWIIMGILILATVYTFYGYYETSYYSAKSFGPSSYTHQWQKAMAWVRDNTPETAVFSHWWDYGYWVQSIGERATVLDGGNAIVYWDHLLGRHVLTGSDEQEALNFLYTHNVTHHLIDSTDIGKYPAFSSIGSDEQYDRYSGIPTFLLNEKGTQETADQMIYFYQGGDLLDEDIVWNENGREFFFPSGKAGIGGIMVYVDKKGELEKVEGVIIYQNQQYALPLKKAYFNGKLYEFGGQTLDSGIFIFSSIEQVSNGLNINDIGACLYLNKKTIDSLLVRNYLFDEKNNFRLVHEESSELIKQLREQNANMGEFIYYQGFHGPIKIWEVSYPSGTEFKAEYLEKQFPSEGLYLP